MTDFTTINQIFLQTDREIWLLTATADAERGGLIATFVSQASIVPDLPRVVVGLAKQHHTTPLVERSRAFVLHLLTEDHIDWVWRFGLQSGRAVDKWAGLSWSESAGGPLLAGALAWLECRVETTLDIGDRLVFAAEVRTGGMDRQGTPLTMRRLIQLAPPERHRELKAGLERDAVVDAAAIRAWRQSRS
jgi:flavin reductase (DIM6/NTAB) family NADH-FMN oxidoreductase RutF